VRVNWHSGESSAKEMQADAFAAELLFPRALVRVAIQRALSPKVPCEIGREWEWTRGRGESIRRAPDA